MTVFRSDLPLPRVDSLKLSKYEKKTRRRVPALTYSYIPESLRTDEVNRRRSKERVITDHRPKNVAFLCIFLDFSVQFLNHNFCLFIYSIFQNKSLFLIFLKTRVFVYSDILRRNDVLIATCL